MMLNAGTARFVFQRIVLRELERAAGRKGAGEIELLNDKQRTLVLFFLGTMESKAFPLTSYT